MFQLLLFGLKLSALHSVKNSAGAIQWIDDYIKRSQRLSGCAYDDCCWKGLPISLSAPLVVITTNITYKLTLNMETWRDSHHWCLKHNACRHAEPIMSASLHLGQCWVNCNSSDMFWTRQYLFSDAILYVFTSTSTEDVHACICSCNWSSNAYSSQSLKLKQAAWVVV